MCSASNIEVKLPSSNSGPNSINLATAYVPATQTGLEKPTNVDKQLAYGFLRLLHSLVRQSPTWTTMPVQMQGRRYPVPVHNNQTAILTLRDARILDEQTASIAKLVVEKKLEEIFIYDTQITPQLFDLMVQLRPHISRLVVRDHHNDELAAVRARALQELYGDRATIQLLPRESAPTCFQLVDAARGELLQPRDASSAPSGAPHRLVIGGPLDIDLINCIAAGLGVSYEGQRNDVMAIEGKDPKASRRRVSKLGDTILDALRVAPMVVGQQGHLTFATLHLIASLVAMERGEGIPHTASQTLEKLGHLARDVSNTFVSSLILQGIRTRELQINNFNCTVSVVDLCQPLEQALRSFSLGGTAGATSSPTSDDVTRFPITPTEVLRAVWEDTDRLRMSTVEDVVSQLVRNESLGENCIVFVRYPEKGGPRTRVVLRGECRNHAYSSALPFLQTTDHRRKPVTFVNDEPRFAEWLTKLPGPRNDNLEPVKA